MLLLLRLLKPKKQLLLLCCLFWKCCLASGLDHPEDVTSLKGSFELSTSGARFTSVETNGSEPNTKSPFCQPNENEWPNLFWNKTSTCYAKASQGPCGEMMALYPVGGTFSNSEYGECVCNSVYDGCQKRLLVEWKPHNRCYPAFDQGPCESGQWILFNKNLEPECQNNPCLMTASSNIIKAATPVETSDIYEFTLLNNSTCYNTEKYCGEMKALQFCKNSTTITPVCSSEESAVVSDFRPCPVDTFREGDSCNKNVTVSD